MIPFCIALTALTDRIRMDELACVAAALQTQVTRDFVPAWGAGAIIAAVPFDAVPAGYCPVIVQDTLESEGVCGLHQTRDHETPYILLPYGPNWSLAASHAILQMLANPTGSARRPGPCLMPGQGTVEYLVDACTPCQDIASAYAINGIVVSDFCLPGFFGGPAGCGAGLSFTGALRERFRPAANGLVTWLAVDGRLYQARAEASGRIRLHGGFSPANRGQMTMRELVDMLTPQRLERLSHALSTAALVEAQRNAQRARITNLARFQEEIAWRFGHASRPVPLTRPEPMLRVRVAQQAGDSLEFYTKGVARSGQQRASGEVATTARTDS
jgi:hypothetical protein